MISLVYEYKSLRIPWFHYNQCRLNGDLFRFLSFRIWVEVIKMGIYDAWNRIRIGEGIETKSLEKGEGHPEILVLYQKWLNAIFDVQQPGYFAKNVSIMFIYKDVRYVLEREEFDAFVIKDGREGPLQWQYDRKVDHARFEALLCQVVYPDLIKLGINDKDIVQIGSLD